MYIKIYFDDKPLFLCDSISRELETYPHHDHAVFINEFSYPAVDTMIQEMKSKNIHAGLFLHSDLEMLKRAFWEKFEVIQAAGGLVFNEENEILFMFRRGKWDLPKGKLDPGESLEECAIREVQEETGLETIDLKEFLLATYHTYLENGRQILKESYWYNMTATRKQTLIPQTDEDITEVKWVGKGNLHEVLGNTYASIREVLSSMMSDE